MADEFKHYATGSVIPLGDGFTGKSVLSRLIINPNVSDEELNDILLKTKKSYNIEIEFSSEVVEVENLPVTATLQFYVFPGQRQKASSRSTTFDEILSVFDCFPALLRVSVLLLIYDVTRFSTLESLEVWLRFAIVKEWIYEDTLILLVPNKVDLEKPRQNDIDQIIATIYEYIADHNLPLDVNHIKAINSSCVTLQGINEIRTEIINWIAHRGIRGVGIK
jgi:hypothetical protein